MKHRQLYWLTTPCNKENWFVVATDIQAAKDFHDHGEGFNEGYSKAKLICDIPLKILKKHFKDDEDWWPYLELLKELNFLIIQEKFPRIVSFEGNIFYEGKGYLQILEDLVCEEHSGVYVVNTVGTEMYKIGYTTNLKSRLKTIRTSIPSQIEVHYFITTNHYKSLEKYLHEEFKVNRRIGEWFEFVEIDINKLIAISQRLTLTGEFKFINVIKIREALDR